MKFGAMNSGVGIFENFEFKFAGMLCLHAKKKPVAMF